MNHTSVLIYPQRRAQTREPSVIYNAISPCVPEWFNVCLRVYLQGIFGTVSSIVRVYLPVCVLSRLTRRNGYPPVLSCCIQTCWPVYTGLSMWVRPWNRNKARASHREDGWLCSGPGNMKSFPLYTCTSVCVWERIILVELPRLKQMSEQDK